MVKLGWKGREIIQALQTVYKNDAPKKTCVYKWIERFRDGREAVEDDEGRGRPTTSKNYEKIDFVRNLVKKDKRLTVYQIAETVGLSVGLAHSILHDNLCLSKLSARWVPKALGPNQLNLRSVLSTAILLKIEADKDRFFLIELSQEMKHGSTCMILKQNSSPNSGSHVDHLAQSNSSLRGLSRRKWQLFSGTLKELC